MIELNEFVNLLSLMEENYNKELPENILKIWYDEFKKINNAKIKKAFIECIKEYPHFPTINQVKQMLDRQNQYEHYQRI